MPKGKGTVIPIKGIDLCLSNWVGLGDTVLLAAESQIEKRLVGTLLTAARLIARTTSLDLVARL